MVLIERNEITVVLDVTFSLLGVGNNPRVVQHLHWVSSLVVCSELGISGRSLQLRPCEPWLASGPPSMRDIQLQISAYKVPWILGDGWTRNHFEEEIGDCRADSPLFAGYPGAVDTSAGLLPRDRAGRRRTTTSLGRVEIRGPKPFSRPLSRLLTLRIYAKAFFK